MLVGVVGKPNVGKSTLFSAATLRTVPIADYPFTTITPNVGVAYLRAKCVHEEMGVVDNPKNSVCVGGTRLISVRIVDIAGLVEGASQGRGLGNQFLDEIRQADALIHVVDASGSTDSEGRKVEAGTNDPTADIRMVEREIDLWILGIIGKDWEKVARITEQVGGKMLDHLADRLTGLGIGPASIEDALLRLHLRIEKPTEWSKGDLMNLAVRLRETTKPSLIAANKADLPGARENVEKLQKGGRIVVPCASEAELLLRRASEHGLIKYTPGDSAFEVPDPSQLTPAQTNALRLVEERVMKAWGGTGVQKAIDQAYFGLLGAVVVYPVEDENKLTDKDGRVLPDVYVMNGGSTALDLAKRVHSDLAQGFLYAIDARSGRRLSGEYVLRSGDIIKIVSSSKRG